MAREGGLIEILVLLAIVGFVFKGAKPSPSEEERFEKHDFLPYDEKYERYVR